MTPPDPRRKSARRTGDATSAHRFKVGQKVRLKGGFGRPAPPSDIYLVTGTLPSDGGAPQYRIRNDSERHERVTTEDSLEPAGQQPRAGGRTDLK